MSFIINVKQWVNLIIASRPTQHREMTFKRTSVTPGTVRYHRWRGHLGKTWNIKCSDNVTHLHLRMNFFMAERLSWRKWKPSTWRWCVFWLDMRYVSMTIKYYRICIPGIRGEVMRYFSRITISSQQYNETPNNTCGRSLPLYQNEETIWSI